MSASELSIIVQSSLTLLLLVLIVFSWWPEQRVDVFRQQMFALRDELFDFAMKGNISFDDPAYVLLRNLMNGYIRYAHNLTPFRTLMVFLHWKYTAGKPKAGWNTEWEKALNKVCDNNVCLELHGFHAKATNLVVGQLVLSPLVLVILVPLFVPFTVLHEQWDSLRAIYNDVNSKIPMQLLEEEAAKS
jgi:hypothetical protein